MPKTLKAKDVRSMIEDSDSDDDFIDDSGDDSSDASEIEYTSEEDDTISGSDSDDKVYTDLTNVRMTDSEPAPRMVKSSTYELTHLIYTSVFQDAEASTIATDCIAAAGIATNGIAAAGIDADGIAAVGFDADGIATNGIAAAGIATDSTTAPSRRRPRGRGRGQASGSYSIETRSRVLPNERVPINDGSYLARDGTKWNKKPTNEPVYLHRPNISNLRPAVANLNTITEFFNFIINDQMIDLIFTYTNTNITIKNSKKMDPKKHIKYVTKVEIRAFIGLLILFGLTNKNNNEINEIWQFGSIYHMDWATATMKRDRFKELHAVITFYDVSLPVSRQLQNDKKRFWKIEQVFNIFQENIKNAVEPSSELCIDEQLCSFRGNSGFRQYMPKKPAKYGHKFWALVDLASDYILDTSIYLGKKDNVRNVNLGKIFL